MDLINDFRDKELILSLSKLIIQRSKKPLNIMEICGGHTHSIMKFGLSQLVGEHINFIHGPGCPVCVMPKTRIDEACKLAAMPGVIFCTLADMLRVPGSATSLQKLRGEGHDIRALYSPLDCIKIAQQNEDKKVIFFAIGFETTTPMSANLVQKTLELGIKNLYFHINHVTVPAPVRAIMSDENVKIDAFLGPSHVSVITGSAIYEDLANEFKRPIAISGFEPLDIMASVLNLVDQQNAGTFEVYNEYARAVRKEGNLKAKELIARYFEPCDFEWRGLGMIAKSGMKLKPEFANIDAREQFDCDVRSANESKACICGKILRGQAKPPECKVFGRACTPQNPIGSCMVSSEGACAAYFKYARVG
ncbi:hydrogenase formation protein HypD [Campylobacter curvus]|uniref:hydrogenase formation protein HypD n=1 Tax=Campylobacter curvus TaxID=200 RepID=UPI0003688A98|nr:hydrogenase formation protein HypD [Campylobacter curvus]QKF61277.1 hydrogenase expression/formation protein HypD [Campylobacter curvus]UEB49592.1 hydrogenase formation protein HypD [Campylobacter curvus]